jgi:hypothetical protein
MRAIAPTGLQIVSRAPHRICNPARYGPATPPRRTLATLLVRDRPDTRH